MAMSNPFDDVLIIFSYTRAQAIEDGVLIDLTEWARETDSRSPSPGRRRCGTGTSCRPVGRVSLVSRSGGGRTICCGCSTARSAGVPAATGCYFR